MSSKSERLYVLDAVRGIAALAVVLRHWAQHFHPFRGNGIDVGALPMFWLLKPFYLHGSVAVTFFFVLSGFVFQWLYAHEIYHREVGAVRFALLRISRLYPLHLLTLLLCLVGQQWMNFLAATHFVYEWDDMKHFLLNLGLIQFWGWENGFSWNGPSWSISVEVGLYAIFFLTSRWIKPNAWTCAGWALLGWGTARVSIIFSAALPFFMGALTWYAWRVLKHRWSVSRQWLLLILTGVALSQAERCRDANVSQAIVGSINQLFGQSYIAELAHFGMKTALGRVCELVLFPLLILTLALAESLWTKLPWRRLHGFGNLSFAIYLLHFPLQLAFACFALTFSMPDDFFMRTSTLMAFFAILISAAMVSYHQFEKPIMVWTRSRLRA